MNKIQKENFSTENLNTSLLKWKREYENVPNDIVFLMAVTHNFETFELRGMKNSLFESILKLNDKPIQKW